MTRVNIDGAGHQVEVDVPDGKLADVARVAKQLWRDTAPTAPKPPGPAFGFHTELRFTQDLDSNDADGR